MLEIKLFLGCMLIQLTKYYMSTMNKIKKKK